MKRIALIPLSALMLFALPSMASADWHQFWANFEKDRQRNQAWPLPFNQADQQSVRSIFGTMVQKGWEQQIVFQSIHFDEETNELNALGEKKLRWVLNNVPAQRASLFIQQSLEPDTNKARVESLQLAASEMMRGQTSPPIVPSGARPVLMPGMNAESQIEAARSQTPTFIPAKSGAVSGSSN